MDRPPEIGRTVFFLEISKWKNIQSVTLVRTEGSPSVKLYRIESSKPSFVQCFLRNMSRFVRLKNHPNNEVEVDYNLALGQRKSFVVLLRGLPNYFMHILEEFRQLKYNGWLHSQSSTLIVSCWSLLKEK